MKIKREMRRENHYNDNQIVLQPNNKNTDPALCHCTVHSTPLRNTQPFMQTKGWQRETTLSEWDSPWFNWGTREVRGQRLIGQKGEASLTSKMPLDTDQGPNSLIWWGCYQTDLQSSVWGAVPSSLLSTKFPTHYDPRGPLQVRGWVTIMARLW